MNDTQKVEQRLLALDERGRVAEQRIEALEEYLDELPTTVEAHRKKNSGGDNQ
jgi:hypothetical protein